MISKRIKHWKERGYTDEQINNHLEYERSISQRTRSERKKNNEKNRDLIKQIKSDLVEKVFFDNEILYVRETVDGVGFWYGLLKKGRNHKQRYFHHFSDYKKEDFIRNLRYL